VLLAAARLALLRNRNHNKGKDLNELLVSEGLARIYGMRTPLPDGRDSREYLAHLRELELEAKALKRGVGAK